MTTFLRPLTVTAGMRGRYLVPILPGLWLLINVLLFLTRAHDRASMIFFGLMVLVAALAFLYLSFLAYAPRFLYRVNKGSRCPNCYAKLKADTGFCPRCGAVVEGPKDSYMSRCAKCGGDVDPDRDFCPHCGSMLKK